MLRDGTFIKHILIDLDGTTAKRNDACFVALANVLLRLGIDDQRLNVLTYRTFLEQPEVLAYRERVGGQRFQSLLRLVDRNPIHIKNMLPRKQAIVGVNALARRAGVSYCTARMVRGDDELNIEIAQATREWLTSHAFPRPTDVTFCTQGREKLYACAQRIEQTKQPVLLIDDLFASLLDEIKYMVPDAVALLKDGLILCGFGAKEIAPHAEIRIAVLPHWGAVDALIDRHVLARKDALP